MKYAVVFTYSFDSDVSVYLFEDKESAQGFLKNNFDDNIRVLEEEAVRFRTEISDDYSYAKIVECFEDYDDEITEMRIGQIYQ